MDPALAPRLRDALVAADFTYDAVAERLGPLAHAALFRNETVPARRRTRGSGETGSPLDTLIRLFLLQLPVGRASAEAALPGLVDRLAAVGMLEQSVGEVAARLDCRPYGTDSGADGEGDDLWVVSDLTPGLDGGPHRVGSDHVLGISAASTSLAQLTVREPVGTALDLGTGCGVQALHLARHARRTVGTDVNRRALDVAAFNAALNGVAPLVEFREGSFFEPVRGERFDLIATNPPFVISPGTGERLVYRDSGLPGDRVVEDIVRAAPRHLNPGGWCQILANWVISRDRPWDERLAEWLEPQDDEEGVDALVVQREILDPASYVELWLKDAGQHGGPDYPRRYDTWLSWFDDQGIEAVGFGWINLRAPGGASEAPAAPSSGRSVELLAWHHDVEQPIAPAVAGWARARDTVVDAQTRLRARPDVVQETQGPVGAEDPATIVLRQQRGLRRARRADTVEAALVGACDGDLAVGAILDAVAQLLGVDPVATRTTYLPVVRELVDEGYLESVQPTGTAVTTRLSV